MCPLSVLHLIPKNAYRYFYRLTENDATQKMIISISKTIEVKALLSNLSPRLPRLNRAGA